MVGHQWRKQDITSPKKKNPIFLRTTAPFYEKGSPSFLSDRILKLSEIALLIPHTNRYVSKGGSDLANEDMENRLREHPEDLRRQMN